MWMTLAGFGGGLVGSVTGLASLVSYPALLALGLSPVAANVTNTVGLVFSSAGSVSGSKPELRGQSSAVRHLLPIALAGGASGGALLLLTPSGIFSLLVPVLIGLASLAVLFRRGAGREAPVAGARPSRALFFWAFLISLYGGYFGAGAGVALLAVLLVTTPMTVARCTALRNLLLGAANAIAGAAFVVFGHVTWWAVPTLAVGFLVGGRLGPAVVRRVPAWPLRVVIAAAGLGLAVHLGLEAYS